MFSDQLLLLSLRYTLTQYSRYGKANWSNFILINDMELWGPYPLPAVADPIR